MVEIEHLESEKKKRRSKKQKKEKKSKREGDDEAPAVDVLDKSTDKVDAKKKKREKKQKKRKRTKEGGAAEKQEAADDVPGVVLQKEPSPHEDADTSKATEEHKTKDEEENVRKTTKKRKDKKMEKENLLAKIPKTNELGVSFTKIEVRKMLKRVKKGLPPIPSSAERKILKKEKKDEEAELANMLYNPEGDDDAADVAGSNISEDATDTEDADDNKAGSDSEADAEVTVGGGNNVLAEDKDGALVPCKSVATKKKPRSKAVPDDYVCFSCKNKHQPKHWIYDCPDKVTVKGTNKVKKRLRGVNDPSAQKVFVSGLPFEIKRKDLINYFEEKCNNTKVVHCKTLSFKDTGRFNGQAYLTFDSDVNAKMALQLDGSTFEVENSEANAKGEDIVPKKRWLKVTKVLNRVVTKRMNIKRKRAF